MSELCVITKSIRLHCIILNGLINFKTVQDNRFTEMQFDFVMVLSIVSCQHHRGFIAATQTEHANQQLTLNM